MHQNPQHWFSKLPFKDINKALKNIKKYEKTMMEESHALYKMIHGKNLTPLAFR